MEEQARQGEQQEGSFRRVVLFIAGCVIIGLVGLLVLIIELPLAVAIGLVRNRWAVWVAPKFFSLLMLWINKTEEWCFPGQECLPIGE